MHTAYDHLTASLLRLRVRFVILSLQWRARWHRAEVACKIDLDARLGRRLRISVESGTRNILRIERGSRLWDDVRIELRGGSLLVGAGVDVKPRCVLGVGGDLTLSGGNVLQQGCILHCDDAITMREHCSLGEYTTVIDSSHVPGGPDGAWLHRIKTSPIVIERNAWICAKATIARGVRIGEGAVVGANSLVVKDVPAGTLASGIPAQIARQLVTEPPLSNGGAMPASLIPPS